MAKICAFFGHRNIPDNLEPRLLELVERVIVDHHITEFWNGGYGECVIIYHGKGNSTLYGHLDNGAYNVKVGDTVRQGDVIAWSGTTGNSTGPHLHFGIKENDTWVDPLNYLTGWHYYG